MYVNEFEELEVWRRAREITKKVYGMTNTPVFRQDWGLRDQVRRSAVSVMSNIAEGFERRSPKEFSRFLDIAKGSCAELRAQLYVIEDAQLAPIEETRLLRTAASELTRMLGSFIRAVRKNAGLSA